MSVQRTDAKGYESINGGTDAVRKTREASLERRGFQTEGEAKPKAEMVRATHFRTERTVRLEHGEDAGRPGSWARARPHGTCGPHAGLMSFQAADQLKHTQIVKILMQESPKLLLDKGSAKVAQMIVLEIFASNEVRRPFFTLGIVS